MHSPGRFILRPEFHRRNIARNPKSTNSPIKGQDGIAWALEELSGEGNIFLHWKTHLIAERQATFNRFEGEVCSPIFLQTLKFWSMSSKQIDQQIAQYSQICTNLVSEVGRALVGQETMVSRLLIGLLTGGHVLLEGVPGLAKTLTVRSLAQAIRTGFSRIQFTPDMLPADVVGTEVFNPKDATYSVKKGPVFSNLVLADEINRAPAKVQAALLEAMQERQVTIGRESFTLEEPFLVLATQNPIEQEGTYPLPEAQVDRFMLKVLIGYPTRDEERKIVDRMAGGKVLATINAVATPEEILQARGVVETIWADDKVRDYVVDVVRATRSPADLGVSGLDGMIDTGASPRASIYLMKSARAHAFLQGRGYVTPHDVKVMAPDVLRHRVIITYEAEAEGRSSDDIIRKILDNVPVP